MKWITYIIPTHSAWNIQLFQSFCFLSFAIDTLATKYFRMLRYDLQLQRWVLTDTQPHCGEDNREWPWQRSGRSIWRAAACSGWWLPGDAGSEPQALWIFKRTLKSQFYGKSPHFEIFALIFWKGQCFAGLITHVYRLHPAHALLVCCHILTCSQWT